MCSSWSTAATVQGASVDPISQPMHGDPKALQMALGAFAWASVGIQTQLQRAYM